MRHLAFVVAALLAAPPVAAQPGATSDTGSVAGVVVAGDGARGVEFARVLDAGTGRLALTDSLGRFLLSGLPAGRRLVEFTAIGYGPARGEVAVLRGRRAEVRVTLVPVQLDTVLIVEDDAEIPREFLDRAREGSATRIFTAEEIARRAPVYTTNLLTLVPGVRVTGTGPRATILPGRGAAPGCVRVYLDGYPARPDEINGTPPSTLAGIEFYHQANAPPQYARHGACAVLLLWTKVPKTRR